MQCECGLILVSFSAYVRLFIRNNVQQEKRKGVYMCRSRTYHELGLTRQKSQ